MRCIRHCMAVSSKQSSLLDLCLSSLHAVPILTQAAISRRTGCRISRPLLCGSRKAPAPVWSVPPGGRLAPSIALLGRASGDHGTSAWTIRAHVAGGEDAALGGGDAGVEASLGGQRRCGEWARPPRANGRWGGGAGGSPPARGKLLARFHPFWGCPCGFGNNFSDASICWKCGRGGRGRETPRERVPQPGQAMTEQFPCLPSPRLVARVAEIEADVVGVNADGMAALKRQGQCRAAVRCWRSDAGWASLGRIGRSQARVWACSRMAPRRSGQAEQARWCAARGAGAG